MFLIVRCGHVEHHLTLCVGKAQLEGRTVSEVSVEDRMRAMSFIGGKPKRIEMTIDDFEMLKVLGTWLTQHPPVVTLLVLRSLCHQSLASLCYFRMLAVQSADERCMKESHFLLLVWRFLVTNNMFG